MFGKKEDMDQLKAMVNQLMEQNKAAAQDAPVRPVQEPVGEVVNPVRFKGDVPAEQDPVVSEPEYSELDVLVALFNRLEQTNDYLETLVGLFTERFKKDSKK